MIYSLYIHYLFIIYSLYIHYIHYIHYILIIYSLYLHYIFIISSLYPHYIFIIYSLSADPYRQQGERVREATAHSKLSTQQVSKSRRKTKLFSKSMFSKFKLHEQGASKQEAEEDDDDDEYNGMNIMYKLSKEV